MREHKTASNTASWTNGAAIDELLSAVTERMQGVPIADRLDLYELLLQAIWQRVMPILGASAMKVIMQRAIELTSIEHPIVVMIEVSEDGVSLKQLRSCTDAGSETLATVHDGLNELIAMLFQLLISLTCDVLTTHLHAAVENGNHAHSS